jgi:uncharacterized membrane protein YqiK
LSDGRTVGYRMVKGGAALRIPLLEKVDYLSLNVMTIPLEIKRAYTLKGVPISVKAGGQRQDPGRGYLAASRGRALLGDDA